MPGVLGTLYRTVQDTPQAAIQNQIKDRVKGQRIGFRATLPMDTGDREKAVLTGFKYLPDPPETIGITAKNARIAAAEDRIVVVFFADRDFRQSLVFHPEAHLEYGDSETKDVDRQQRGEHWLNLPREWAVPLMAYAEGRDTPRSEPQPGDTTTDGGWFDV